MIQIRNPKIAKNFTQILKAVNLTGLRLPLVITLSSIFLLACAFPVNSKTLEEIEKEIAEKEKELETLEGDLKEAQNLVNYYQAQGSGVSSELEQIENELKGVEAEIEVNEVEMEKIKQELELAKLELEQKELVMGERMVELYIYERQGVVDMVIENGGMEGFWKDIKYRETLLDQDFSEIDVLAEEVEDIRGEKTSLESSLSVLAEENERLSKEKEELTSRIAYFNSMVAYNTNVQSGIRAQMTGVQQQIDGLTAEHKKMLEDMGLYFGNANSGGTLPLQSGQYYFYGIGHFNQGHGLGFSQYGAKGGGLKGMSAKQIAAYYYKGSSIGSASGDINVIGYGWMDIEDYVAGLGEVPDYACGSQAQQDAQPDKYRVSDPNLWEGGCWPEEAIKAQVIVARSYGLAYGGAICTSATCQVYKGGYNKKWAAEETDGQVLKVGGSIIKAFYSSDNNNGWGTGTHRKPVWCWDFAGNCGEGFSWLQSVKDESFAAPGPYDDFVWRTNGYSLSDFDAMFTWYANSGNVYAGNVANLRNNVGKVKGFSMQRDPSGRVHKILVKGTKGEEWVNGEKFQYIWLMWNAANDPSGQYEHDGGHDYIYSLTFYFIQA